MTAWNKLNSPISLESYLFSRMGKRALISVITRNRAASEVVVEYFAVPFVVR